jgi:CheY-like chemotaxis protein
MLDPKRTRAETSPSLIQELAHELRDALSPLASSADLARLRKFDTESSRLLAEKVERGLRRALTVLDTFLLAEQCENGSLPLQLRPVRLEELLKSARDAVGDGARYKVAAAEADATVRADQARSVQALVAVLQHAAAIAAPDRALELRVVGTAAQPQIRIRGRLGPGNLAGAEWFASYRGGDGRMALRTARRIMALQGGGLDLLQDRVDEFELVMQFVGDRTQIEAQHGVSQAARTELQRQPRAEPVGPKRILIVEDNAEVRRAYSEALTALGYSVQEAADAEQTLAALEGSKPDVALIDIHLPGMNGYRLAQAIRARAGGAIYLVMLSGTALDAVTRELAREAGFDDCLDKMAGPIALRELLEAGGSRG